MLRLRTHQSFRQLLLFRASRVGMSTFILPDSESVPVSLPSDLTKDQLLSFPAFKNWHKTLQHNLSLQSSDADHEFHQAPYSLRSIDVQAVDWFGGGKRLGFIKMKAEVKNDEGQSLPGSVFLRGPSVGMLIILQPDDIPSTSTKDRHVLLTLQPRVPAGSLRFPELPAGMVDDSGTFAGAAAKEIQEELDLTIPESELINLTELALSSSSSSPSSSSSEPNNHKEESLTAAMYPSAGGSDEHISLFLHTRRIPREQLKDWSGKLTGLRESGEMITLMLVRFEELWRVGARDGKALAAWALYEALRGEGRLA